MTVSELFKKYDFESILPHLNHLFMVNSGRHFTDASIEVFRGLYKKWTECETKPTNRHIRLVSRWEHTSPSIELVRLHSKNLIRYQDTYAEQMAAYGLQRGIKGSEAQHISTHKYYRSLIAQGEDLQADIAQLLEEQEKASLVIAEAEQAKKDIARIKAETRTEELKSSTLVACLSKNSATRTATSVLNGVNSLFGGNKVSRLEKENSQLHREVDDLNDQIERLHTDMQKTKDNHARELNRTNEQHQQEVSNLKRILDKAYEWFPSFKRFLNIECECLQ